MIDSDEPRAELFNSTLQNICRHRSSMFKSFDDDDNSDVDDDNDDLDLDNDDDDNDDDDDDDVCLMML